MAKSFKSFTSDISGKNEKESKNDSCFAWRCPILPTITIGNERTCRWHVRKNGDRLHAITENLKANRQLVAWHDILISLGIVDYDVKKIHNLAPLQYRPMDNEEYFDYSPVS